MEARELSGNQAEVVAHINHMFQATSFATAKSYGNARISPTGTDTTIDEETNAAVVARALFEDVLGNGSPAIASPFVGSRVSIPMRDEEGRTAWYHGYYRPTENRPWLTWAFMQPPVTHTEAFITGRAIELNVPGSSSTDRDAFVYYASNSVFNISGNVSHAIWFYPVAIAEAAEVFMFLQWRYIDASNWYAVVIRTTTNQLQVHVREGGTTFKLRSTGTITYNAWNLIIWTYAPSTNTIVLELNNSTSTATPTETLTVPYTADANMYLGNIPNSNPKRFEGYLGNYTMWNILLSTTQRDNFWTRGTIA
jgi:Concanavalin A-like lectin/glucanases superfamily